MSPGEAMALGALQGATEFLPISSSGHLRLAEAALNAHPASVLFDIALHVGTLVAVVAFFWRDVVALVVGLLPKGEGPWRSQPAVRALLALVVASVPTAAIGLGLSRYLEGHVPVAVVGGLLLLNGLVLLSTRGRGGGAEVPRGMDWGIGLGVAFLIGLAQGVAVLPGISRSGATIAMALLCGVSWRPAAVFSFLLSIPAILGALLLHLGDAEALSDSSVSLALGVGVAVVVGVACLALLVGLLRKARFHHFAWYCFALGATAIVWGLTG
jgi:undecaprenyl-diphosphatase